MFGLYLEVSCMEVCVACMSLDGLSEMGHIFLDSF